MRALTFQLLAALLLTGVTLVTGTIQSTGENAGADPAFVSARSGDIEITAGFVRAMLPGQPAGGGFVTIVNAGGSADGLVAASSPQAGKVEIHTMEVKDGVMVMRPVDGALEIPAGGMVEMKPGGLHLMFMQVEAPFPAGSTVEVTLEFATAGKVELALPVRAPGQD